MKDSALIELLRSFTEEEFEELGRAIKSPFFKTLDSEPIKGNLEPLYEYLLEYYPKFKHGNFRMENASMKYTGKPYNKNVLNILMSKLTTIAERMLVFNRTYKNEIDHSVVLGNLYQERNIPAKALLKIRTADEKLRYGFSVAKDFTSRYKKINRIKDQHFVQKEKFKELIKSKNDYITKSCEQFIWDFIDFYGSIKPLLSNYGKNVDTLLVQTLEKCFDFETFIQTFIKKNNTGTPYLEIAYCLMKVLKKSERKNNANYKRLKYLVFKEIKKKERSLLDREEKHKLLNHLSNPLTQEYTMESISDLLNVYKVMFKENVYSESEGDSIEPAIYRNVMTACLTLNDTEFLEHFITNYSDELHPDNKKDMKDFVNAHFEFLNKKSVNTQKVIKKQELIKKKDVIEIDAKINLGKTDLRILKLMMLYEDKNLVDATGLANTFARFLADTNIIGKDNLKLFKKFLDYYRELVIIKYKYDTGKIDGSASFFKDKIEKQKEKTLTSRRWLVEKADELIAMEPDKKVKR